MIRELRKADINKVANIWLDTNITAHYFIPAQYWQNNFELVKELLLQATVYVYEHNQEIQGFIGLNDEYVEGIFVSDEMQSQGIGKVLLNYAKDKRSKLLLNVYQKNTRAISFYQREGFEIQHSGLDEATGEKDYVMAWHQKKFQFAEPARALAHLHSKPSPHTRLVPHFAGTLRSPQIEMRSAHGWRQPELHFGEARTRFPASHEPPGGASREPCAHLRSKCAPRMGP